MGSKTDELCAEIAERLLPTATDLARRMGVTFGITLDVKPVLMTDAPRKAKRVPKRPDVHPVILNIEAAISAYTGKRTVPRVDRLEAAIYTARSHLGISWGAISKHFKLNHEETVSTYCRAIAKVDDDDPVFNHLIFHAKQGAARA